MWYKSFSRLTVVAIRPDNEIRSTLKRDPFSHGAEVEVLICTRPLSSFLLAAHDLEWSYDCPTEWSYWGKELRNSTRHFCRALCDCRISHVSVLTSPSFQVVSRILVFLLQHAGNDGLVAEDLLQW